MLSFQQALQGRDIKTDIVDLSKQSLFCADEKLFVKGESLPIDLVYKRILWKDLVNAHSKTEEALSEAFINNYATIVNSLGARMAGNKVIMAMIKAPEFSQWLSAIDNKLTEQEVATIEKNIPATYVWGETPNDFSWQQDQFFKDNIIEHSQRFVLKSFHGYGGHEVVIGCEQERPQAQFEALWNQGHIAQSYVPHGRALMPIHNNGEVNWEYHYFILGAYVIDGKCVAIEAKTSAQLPINMTKKALRTAVFPTV